ncbi:uncharacterized protein LOC130759150 [Actinidia eriantha]|uniref:uncharacterized protein LOC130759150 n=1 Tax=Actinidia eriantha TaxID=165200 RepID=UPI002587F3FC|nr:uncharacterized protein LOC130759150 [Actinidia eriantha]
MAALSNCSVLSKNSPLHLSSGSSLKSTEQCLGNLSSKNLSSRSIQIGKKQIPTSRRGITVRAGYSDGGRPGSASIFVGGFVLGGIIVGALGCVYAPQISKALAGSDGKDLMRKLPKFIYDEEKEREKIRKTLAEKIAQLNSDLDDISAQYH